MNYWKRMINMSEMKQLVAFLFMRCGKEKLTMKDLKLTLSIDLHWFSPDEAENIIRKAITSGLLIEENGILKPSFDYTTVKIPIDFRPGRSVLEHDEDVFTSIVNAITRDIGIEKTEIIKEINEIQQTLDTEIEVSAMIIARKYGIDISIYIPEIEKKIKKSFY